MKYIRKKRNRQAIFCVLLSSTLLLSTSGLTHAEETGDYSLGEVVVTATKTPVKEFEANANITVVNREQIEKNHYQDLTEALRDVPGVNIVNYGNKVGYEYSSGISINGSPQIVVLIDGIRANMNGSDFTVFPAGLMNNIDQIERIEVLKGAASSLYGSDAKGGVINIITRKADSNKTTLTITGGSFGKENYAMTNMGKAGDYSWLVTSQKDITSNFSDANGLERPSHSNATTNSIKLTKKINANSDITFDYSEYQRDYDRYSSATDFKLKHGENDNSSWRIVYNNHFSSTSSNQLALYQNKMNMTDGTWIMNTKTKGLQDQFTQQIGKNHIVTLGFDIYQDSIDYKYGTYVSYKGDVTNRAVYLQDEWNITNKWKLTTGVRNDNHSVYGNHVSPSINLGYKQDEKTNYYVSYKKYFVAPNLDELYDTLYGGNINLKPETGHTAEAGVNHKFDDSCKISAHIFETSSEDAIAYVGTMSGGQYVNLNHEIAHGWDIQLDKKISPYFKAYANYTNTTYNISGLATPVMGYAHLPRGMWNVGVDYKQGKCDIGVQGHGNVDLPGILPANTYWIWDMAINYSFDKHKKAFIKLNNMFDRYYAIYGTPQSGYYTCPGRNYQIGMQYQF